MAADTTASEVQEAQEFGRSVRAGMLLAAAAAAKSFERTLMPRTTRDQGVVTGLSAALVYATGAMFQDVIENAAAFVVKRDGNPANDASVRRATMLADLAAVGTGVMLQRALAQQENEELGRAAMRTSGNLLMFAGVAGFTAGFVEDLLNVISRDKRVGKNRPVGVVLLGGGALALIAEYRRRRAMRLVSEEDAAYFQSQEWRVEGWKSLAMGAGVTAALGSIALGERVVGAVTGAALQEGMPGSARFWRMAGHGAALGALGALAYVGLDNVYQSIEAGTGKIEPGFSSPPESTFVSGCSESAVPWKTMGREGRRHVVTVLTRESISEVMGQPAQADPIRVFVGLESARTELERVDLAVQELKRTGAFDRKLLIAVSPTGTGYVNYVAIESCEYYTLGNCATVTLQYSKRPSPMSLDRVWEEGRKQFRMLLAAIRRELYKREPQNRPRVVVFGESLGAHTSQDAFLNEGTQGLEDAGVERALWIGSPHLSKWRAQVLQERRADVDPALVADVDNFGEIEQLPSEARSKLRYVMVTHHNDGVGLFGPDLIIQRPPWLGDPDFRPPSVPKWMRWSPIVTAVQTVVDMQNAMNVVPGEFVANGHDYRADLARFVREVYGLSCTDEQLERVEVALRKYELVREAMLEIGTDAGEPAEPGANGSQPSDAPVEA